MNYDRAVGQKLVNYLHSLEVGIYPYYFNVDSDGNFRAQVSDRSRNSDVLWEKLKRKPSLITTGETRGNYIMGKFRFKKHKMRSLVYTLPEDALINPQSVISSIDNLQAATIQSRFIQWCYDRACEYIRSCSYYEQPSEWVDQALTLSDQWVQAVNIIIDLQKGTTTCQFEPNAERYLEILIRDTLGIDNYDADTCFNNTGKWVS